MYGREASLYQVLEYVAAISGTVCSVEVQKMPLGRVLTLRRRQSRRRVPYIFHSLPDIRENLVEQRRPQLHPPAVAIVSEPSPWWYSLEAVCVLLWYMVCMSLDPEYNAWHRDDWLCMWVNMAAWFFPLYKVISWTGVWLGASIGLTLLDLARVVPQV